MLAVTLAVLGVYLASPVLQSGDGRLVIYEAQSVLTDGNLDLHEYGGSVHGFPCYREGHRILSRYPYGTALVTVPVLAAVRAGGSLLGDDPTASLTTLRPRTLEKTLASIIAAFAVLALMLMARSVLGRTAPAVLLGVLFALGTSLWSTVSRGLWQHGPLILLCALGLLFLARGRERDERRWPALAGAAFAAAYVVRPTAVVPLGFAGLALLIWQRRAVLPFAAAAALVLIPSFAYNLWVYGQIAIPFYVMNGGFLGGGIRPTFGEGLAGTMISPARGLLVYSPFVLLAAGGRVDAAAVARERGARRRRLGARDLAPRVEHLRLARRLELRPAAAGGHPALPRLPHAAGARRGHAPRPHLDARDRRARRRPPAHGGVERLRQRPRRAELVDAGLERPPGGRRRAGPPGALLGLG